MSKRVTVTLVGLKNVDTGPDPGANLEVYGDLYARRVGLNELGEFFSIQTHHLFHVVSGDSINISNNSVFSLNRTAPELVIEPGEWLWVGGHLAEQDEFPNPNDNLGFRDDRISHDQIQPGPRHVHFEEGGQKVDAMFNFIVA